MRAATGRWRLIRAGALVWVGAAVTAFGVDNANGMVAVTGLVVLFLGTEALHGAIAHWQDERRRT